MYVCTYAVVAAAAATAVIIVIVLLLGGSSRRPVWRAGYGTVCGYGSVVWSISKIPDEHVCVGKANEKKKEKKRNKKGTN